jgi:carbon storage regulator
MLLMTRREGESIRIDDDIEIVISHIGRTRVKVGVRAPRSLPVVMREVEMVREENLAAAAAVAGPAMAAIPDLIARMRPAARYTEKPRLRRSIG